MGEVMHQKIVNNYMIKELVDTYPNDMELGGKIRSLFTPTQEDKEYLEYWTCDICGEHTHNVDYDYLGSGTNHLGCELKLEIDGC